ncbi:ribonuclease kappa-B-like [Diorhabda carinulata]|uniref:ribonuclease kappa-B-like n=1 Tax=Diorhabda sublineata TaxID=1163346 RepID=UPI0024E18C9D|nr:ribonuclease kappa-B-like [Diorhabda sublineata]XP_057653939.1 ribonuclease kappa-B-like [Diorhabda carinulata]
MPCCGPKLSLCGIILSTWGVIQLGLMGVFYITGSVALAEDIPAVEFSGNLTEFYNEVDNGFKQNAYNCWIAALLYLILLIISAQQFWANSRSSLNV